MSIDAPGFESASPAAAPLPSPAVGSTTAPHSTALPRPWWRWHRSTWVALLPTVAVLVIVNVSGFLTLQQYIDEYHYGWPLTYLVRGFGGKFHWPALVVDLLVAGATVAALGGGLEFRRRRRRSAWQFTIRDLGWMTLLIAGVLAYGRSQWLTHVRQTQWLAARRVFDIGWESAYPEWIRRRFASPETEEPPLPGDTVFYINVSGYDQLQSDGNYLAGVEQFSKLRWLDTSECNLIDDDLAPLGRLPDLTTLNLNGNPITDAGLEHLAGLAHLESLYLADTNVSGLGLERLTALFDLRDLEIDGMQLDDACLRELASFPSLEVLSLESCGLDDGSMELIALLPRLRRLHIGNSPVTDVGLMHLEKLEQLRIVYAYDTCITSAGVKRLRARRAEPAVFFGPRPAPQISFNEQVYGGKQADKQAADATE
jgi:hypothetical protein